MSHSALKAKSLAHDALTALGQLGGTAKLSALYARTDTDFKSLSRFRHYAIRPLILRGYARSVMRDENELIIITPSGRERVVDQVSVHNVRYTPAPKPLDASKHRYVERRAGSHDYRRMPSLMAGQRHEYWAVRGTIEADK